MKRVAGIAIALIFFAGFSGTSQADEFKPYIGLGTGVFAVGFKLNDPLVSSFSQRNPTWGSFIKAGVDVNKYFGAELRIGLTGNPSTDWGSGLPVGSGLITLVPSTVSTKINHFFSYLGKVQYPFNEAFKVYGMFGGTTAKYTAKLSIAGLNFDENATKTGFTFGGGIEFMPSENISVGLEWVEYWTDVTISTAGSTDKGSFRGLSATVSMSF